jgi:dTDP-glucose 4,6-dehydratase
MILVTGGAGFIGSNFVIDWLSSGPQAEPVLVVDALTYAGNLGNLDPLAGHPGLAFVAADVTDSEAMRGLLAAHRPRAVLHFAAESHVDRSISGPGEFMRTNVQGTYALLEAVRAWWGSLDAAERAAFRFLHVSTDEVYGSLGPSDPPFSEATAYAPNSPYAASKAASDHLVRAYHHTYGLPTLVTNCSNNYGPRQFPEKLIPLMIGQAMAGAALPVYGDGSNVRDWLYVGDHASALRAVLERAQPGARYNIGGRCERANLALVQHLCAILDELAPDAAGSHARRIAFVADRPGHDWRYAIDDTRIATELGWRPAETFESGLRRTVAWYLGAQDWLADIASGAYRSRRSLGPGAARLAGASA